ncbi:hypothetical protein D1007_41799 [Hordeum vulgare]|nr:hypothetical protein D1007_41799 [Hordeum vulgare]
MLVPCVASPIPSAHSEEESEEESEEPAVEEREEAEEEREEAKEEREEDLVAEDELEEGEYAVEESAKDIEWPVPKETKIWLRGVSTLPSRPYPHKGIIVKPVGEKAFVFIPETIIPPRQPNTIIGCLCRRHYPGLVSIGDGEEEPTWSWEHWKRARDTKDKWGREYRNAAERVVNGFWDFFTCVEGMEDEANDIVEEIAKKVVQDMPYHDRVNSVVKYFAYERKRLLPKALARRVNLTRSMYMKNRERGEGEELLNTFTGLCLSRPPRGRKQVATGSSGQCLLQQEQAMKMQQSLIQQEEFMAKQQAALEETFARFSNNMQCSTLPDLPPVPPLPTIIFSGEHFNDFVVAGSTPTQASPMTRTAAQDALTSMPQ